jgi:hypothetical protein
MRVLIATALLLFGCAVPPEPEPAPPGTSFPPAYVERHPPTCYPQDLAELMVCD